jgi:di/tricarboxylate transporter
VEYSTTNEHSNKNNRHKQKNSNSYAKVSFLALGQGATAGAVVLMISTTPNLTAKATAEIFVSGETISFTDWLIVGSSHAVIGLLVSWIVIFSTIKPEITSLPVSCEQFKVNLKRWVQNLI